MPTRSIVAGYLCLICCFSFFHLTLVFAAAAFPLLANPTSRAHRTSPRDNRAAPSHYSDRPSPVKKKKDRKQSEKKRKEAKKKKTKKNPTGRRKVIRICFGGNSFCARRDSPWVTTLWGKFPPPPRIPCQPFISVSLFLGPLLF